MSFKKESSRPAPVTYSVPSVPSKTPKSVIEALKEKKLITDEEIIETPPESCKNCIMEKWKCDECKNRMMKFFSAYITHQLFVHNNGLVSSDILFPFNNTMGAIS
eukprot:TRINITY_DN751_c0_g1_i1.p1 TRINITY_DN751_c0_g1~~TRINITY_DN751_c0_g1_i1.p1  ORF type:complete len:105 (+),score=11.88 TRINITY_DN751_c0_g1_i1:160-474(+)